ncbi:MAG: DoxX family protein [Bacteroidetes bacterium]|nr:DoxX family protein [Bacteroidota bacterium]
MTKPLKPPIWLFTLIRILIGWHFLYEGLVKLLNPNWSSALYLLESTWIFSEFFKSIALNPNLLAIVNFLNIWGLLLIGCGLFFGLLTRISAISGAALLLLYYVAQPPFTGIILSGNVEGSYLWVNKNLIEFVTLILLFRLPQKWLFSIDNLLVEWKKDKKEGKRTGAIEVPQNDNPVFSDLPVLDRRRVIKNLVSIPILGGFSYAILKNFGYESYEEKSLKIDGTSSASVKTRNFAGLSELKEKPPMGKIGNLEVSRLICGGNLIAGFAHSRDLIYVSRLLKTYFTNEKIWETFRLCEAAGINSAIVRTASDTIKVMNRYWKLGGNIQWLAQTYPKDDDVITNSQWAIDSGASAVYIQGNIADRWLAAGRLDLFEKWINHFQGKGVPIGIGGHELDVVKAMEENNFPVDFYMKTLHPNNYWSYQSDEPKPAVNTNSKDNYWSRTPNETIDYMKNVDKPWIAFKTLAAGALKPKEGFKYAFENGADFACVGMFDYQVVEDCNILADTLKNIPGRTRKFF